MVALRRLRHGVLHGGDVVTSIARMITFYDRDADVFWTCGYDRDGVEVMRRAATEAEWRRVRHQRGGYNL